MAIMICPECGEMCREYDMYCPRCGASCTRNGGCDGVCFNCEHDTPFGCGKPKEDVPFSSPYPHSVVERKGKLVMLEDGDRRSRWGTALLAFLPTGIFGVHDFYARRWVWGVVHLLLVFLGIAVPQVSFGAAALVSWGVAVAEAVLILARVVKNDGMGFPFA